MTLDVGNINSSPRVEAGSELQHLQRLVDLDAIRQLVAIYPILVDSHDLEHLVALFTEDATFHRAGHVHIGREELRRFYAQIMATYSMAAHVGHQHVVDLAPGAGFAVGVQMGHGELEMAGQRVVAAYRYDDEYRCVEGQWLFARREMRYQYFSTHEELGRSLSGRQRVRVPGAEPRDAEIPEDLSSYQAALAARREKA
ncbi:nuclear transport factor 2 family protein [Nocardia sp. NPDC127606]|uniref:nuclear transport factor 2 family protein n=1 Tax=Nocardia sp. NPDC127606 TaxID=3345406 RepID=UPI00362C780D